MKRQKKTAKQLTTHAYVRAAQRYDISLDEQHQAEIVSSIQRGECELIERQSNNRTLWRVIVSETGVIVGVVYDRKRKSLVTVISPDDPRMQRPHDEDRKGD
jgi:hypothetical protein